jgi:LysM repeat protein
MDGKQFAVTTQAYDPALKKNNSLWRPGYSNLSYDVNGHLSGAVDIVGNRQFRYINDAHGQILLRDEIAGNSVNRIQRYYYVDGHRVGDVGNDGPSRTDYVTALAKHSSALNSKSIKGNADKYANFRPIASADFDQNYEPISPVYPGATATAYTVKNGDTLQSIAQAVWGDSAMWYLIADANGLDASQALTAGMNLTIPNKVTNIHNNSSTYRVYNPGCWRAIRAIRAMHFNGMPFGLDLLYHIDILLLCTSSRSKRCRHSGKSTRGQKCRCGIGIRW